MSRYTKLDFVGAKDLSANGKEKVDYCLNAANNRGQHCFDALAQYGFTTQDTPLSLAEMQQLYTIPDVAAVDGLAAAMGIRWFEFMEALEVASTAGNGVVLNGTWSAGNPIEIDFGGWFQGGTVISWNYASTGEPTGSYSFTVPKDMPAEEVAYLIAEEWRGGGVEIDAHGYSEPRTAKPSSLFLEPRLPGTALSITLFTVT